MDPEAEFYSAEQEVVQLISPFNKTGLSGIEDGSKDASAATGVNVDSEQQEIDAGEVEEE